MIRKMLKRTTSVLLAFLLMATSCPLSAMAAGTTPDSLNAIYQKTTDPATLNGWVDYLHVGDTMDTDMAGSVWTDKSVFASGKDYNDALPTGEKLGEAKAAVGDENFLVSLSAITTNKAITGYDTIPTDTVLVLDVSSSMYKTGPDNVFFSETFEQMAAAVNAAINNLQNLNQHNRVGVLLYFGGNKIDDTPNNGENSTNVSTKNHYMVLLPLDRYHPDGNEYLTVTCKKDNAQNIRWIKLQVKDNVKNSANTLQSVFNGNAVYQAGVKDEGDDFFVHYIAGTYTQLGIAKAAEMLLGADTVVPHDADQQAGQPRLPVMVLMSDGKPTSASSDYENLGNDEMGNNSEGNRNPVATDFVTQLTAALAKEKVDRHYVETKPLFYTLALGQTTSIDVMDPTNPNGENKGAIQLHWNNLIQNGSVELSDIRRFHMNSEGGYNSYDREIPLTVSKANNITVGDETFSFPTSIEQQNYVDRAFVASNAFKLTEAFASIVGEIKLQSLYTPTFVGSSNRELSGYVEFHDTIGDYMEVKDIKGIQLGSELHTGAEFAKEICKGTEAAKLTEKLVNSMVPRMNLDSKATAASLINSAKADGQIFYTDANNWSNYAGWYANANGDYLAFWNGSDPAADTTKPDNAVYTVKSYGYLGDYRPEEDLRHSDLLYVSTQVHTNIATGRQEVVWRIPSALLPLLTFQVTLAGSSLDSSVQRVDINNESPMRLLYKVGLRGDVDPFNLSDTATNAAAGDGSYRFYTNLWDQTSLTGGNKDQALAANTYSSFEPSKENEHFYFAFDRKIYSDDQGNLYTGQERPTAGYWKDYVFAKQQNGTWASKPQYTKIAEDVLAKATRQENAAEGWYIPRGTPMEIGTANIAKAQNPTATVADYKHLVSLDLHDTVYHSNMVLGNNGRLVLTPTGIAITKTVDSSITGNDLGRSYTFTITPDNTQSMSTITLSGSYATRMTQTVEGQIVATNGTATADADGKLTVTLQAGQTLQIIGLPVGSYTVAEVIPANAGYDVSSINGQSAYGTTSTVVEVTKGQFAAVSFENTADLTGWLSITKQVEHPLGEGYTVPTTLTFPITVQLDFATGVTPITEVKVKSSLAAAGAAPTSVILADGAFRWELHHNETISVELPNGTTTIISEDTGDLTGFTASYAGGVAATTGTGVTVSIERGEADPAVTITNHYNPGQVTETVTLTGTKELKGRQWKDGDAFEFVLERFDSADVWTRVGNTASVTNTDHNFSFSEALAADLQTLDAGEYYYRITENEGSLGGVTYTNEVRSFTVAITDADMDGKLEISSITSGSGQQADAGITVTKTTGENATGYAIAVSFVNSYAPVGSAAVDIKVNKSVEDSANTGFLPEGFKFGLYDAIATEPFITRTTDVDGAANFRIMYESREGENLFQVEEGKDPVTQRVFTYYLKEIIPATSAPGVTYDEQVYTVYVTVTDNQDGTLSAVPELVQGMQPARPETGETLERPDDEDPKVNGKTDEEEQDSTTGDKGLVVVPTTPGAPDDSKLPLMPPAGPQDGGGQSDPASDDPDTPADDQEDDKDDVETVAANEVEERAITVPSVTAAFTNSYRPDGAKITLTGEKYLADRSQNAGEFAFRLYAADKQWQPQGEPVATVTTQAQAEGKFGYSISQSYSTTGIHRYVLVEQNTGLGGIAYDETQYRIQVTVEDVRASGKLQAMAQVLAPAQKDPQTGSEVTLSGLDFENNYSAQPAEVVVQGKKTFRNGRLSAGQFAFELYPADSSYRPTQNAVATTVTNNADGSFAFGLGSFARAGSFYYIAAERDDGQKGVVYDGTTYGICVMVRDNLAGSMVAEVSITNLKSNATANQLLFQNYVPVSSLPTRPRAPKKTETTPKENPSTGAVPLTDLLPLGILNGAAIAAAWLKGRKRCR